MSRVVSRVVCRVVSRVVGECGWGEDLQDSSRFQISLLFFLEVIRGSI